MRAWMGFGRRPTEGRTVVEEVYARTSSGVPLVSFRAGGRLLNRGTFTSLRRREDREYTNTLTLTHSFRATLEDTLF